MVARSDQSVSDQSASDQSASDQSGPDQRKSDQFRALSLSTFAFTICFAAWTIFSIIGVKIKADLLLNDTQFGLLVATPVLTGSLSRLALGIWTDQYGGRVMFPMTMLCSAVATWLLSTVSTYPMMLLAALGVGLGGGSFAVGISYVSRWYESGRQGTALGIFGIGNGCASHSNSAADLFDSPRSWRGRSGSKPDNRINTLFSRDFGNQQGCGCGKGGCGAGGNDPAGGKGDKT